MACPRPAHRCRRAGPSRPRWPIARCAWDVCSLLPTPQISAGLCRVPALVCRGSALWVARARACRFRVRPGISSSFPARASILRGLMCWQRAMGCAIRSAAMGRRVRLYCFPRIPSAAANFILGYSRASLREKDTRESASQIHRERARASRRQTVLGCRRGRRGGCPG